MPLAYQRYNKTEHSSVVGFRARELSLHDISVNHKRIAETETMPMTIVKMLNEILQKKIQTSTFQTSRGKHTLDHNHGDSRQQYQRYKYDLSSCSHTSTLSYGGGNQISISTSSSTSDDASTIHTKSI